MRLASHLAISKSNNIEDGAISCEESVEGEAEIGFLDLFGEVGQIESVIV